jgi:hypothetical protein
MEVQILKNSNDINYKIIVNSDEVQIPFRSNHLFLKLLKKKDVYFFDTDLIDNINKYNKLNSEMKEILKDINESLQDLLNESNN